MTRSFQHTDQRAGIGCLHRMINICPFGQTHLSPRFRQNPSCWYPFAFDRHIAWFLGSTTHSPLHGRHGKEQISRQGRPNATIARGQIDPPDNVELLQRGGP
jgi:hypothetical protein